MLRRIGGIVDVVQFSDNRSSQPSFIHLHTKMKMLLPNFNLNSRLARSHNNNMA